MNRRDIIICKLRTSISKRPYAACYFIGTSSTAIRITIIHPDPLSDFPHQGGYLVSVWIIYHRIPVQRNRFARMGSIGIGRRYRRRETVKGHNLRNSCCGTTGFAIAAIVSVGRFLPPPNRNKRITWIRFIDLHLFEHRRGTHRVNRQDFSISQTLHHGIHVEIKILYAGRLAVGIVAFLGDRQDGIDSAIGGNDRESVVTLEIENIHQGISLRFAAARRGYSDALTAFAADRTGSGRAGLSPVDKGDALPGNGKGLFITARRQEHSRPSGLFRCDGGWFVVDFHTRNGTNQCKGSEYECPYKFNCTCFLHSISIK